MRSFFVFLLLYSHSHHSILQESHIYNQCFFSFSLWPDIVFCFVQRTVMTGYRATAPDCPSWAPCRRDRTPARPRCLTRPPRTSSHLISRLPTSPFRTTRVRTRTHMWMTPTLSTRCTSHSSTHGARASGRRWAGRAARSCLSLAPPCRSSRGSTLGETTPQCAGQTCCSTPLTMALRPGWETACRCTGSRTEWRTCRWVRSLQSHAFREFGEV